MLGATPLGRLPLALVIGGLLVFVLGFALRRRATELATPEARRRLAFYLWSVAVLPWLWVVAFYALVVRARLRLGFWPYPQHPGPSGAFGDTVPSPLDPTELGVHSTIVAYTAVVLLAAPLIGAMLSIIARVVLDRRRADLALVTTIAGSLVALMQIVLDPGGFFRWFMD